MTHVLTRVSTAGSRKTGINNPIDRRAGRDLTVSRTLPDHARCGTHRGYKLSCEQYEHLLARSGQRCEICRDPGCHSVRGKLHIDHCGSRWAVRGLLCNGCNTQLEDDNCKRPGSKEYLANAWWEQECAALGLPAGRRPEPALGSAIRNQWGTIWIHHEQACWYAPTQDGHGWPTMSWGDLYGAYGPHNLVPLDLRQALDNHSLPDPVSYALHNAVAWTAVRSALGLPEPQTPKPREYTARDALPWLNSPESTARALRVFMSRDECRRIAELLTIEANRVPPTKVRIPASGGQHEPPRDT